MDYCRKMTGNFFQDEIKTGRDITGYDWRVIVDPTRSEDDPGLFYAGLFRMVDLRLDRDEKSTWPDGIVFEHKLTGQRLTFEKGKLFDLTHNKALVRKPRERTRKGKPVTKKVNQNSTICRMRRFILLRIKDATRCFRNWGGRRRHRLYGWVVSHPLAERTLCDGRLPDPQ